MARFVHADVYDAHLQYIIDNCDLMTLCKGQPTTYAEATTDYGTGTNKKLADVAMDSGDFSIDDDDAETGRELNVAAQTEIDVDVTEEGDHVALLDSINSKILLVVPLTEAVAVDSSGTVTIPAWKYVLPAPTA